MTDVISERYVNTFIFVSSLQSQGGLAGATTGSRFWVSLEEIHMVHSQPWRRGVHSAAWDLFTCPVCIVPSHQETWESQQERTWQPGGQATACLWQLFSDSLGHNAVGAWPFSFSKTFCLSRNVHTLVLLSSERLLCLVFMQQFMFSFSMKIQNLSKKYFGRQRKIVFISLFWGRNK